MGCLSRRNLPIDNCFGTTVPFLMTRPDHQKEKVMLKVKELLLKVKEPQRAKEKAPQAITESISIQLYLRQSAKRWKTTTTTNMNQNIRITTTTTPRKTRTTESLTTTRTPKEKEREISFRLIQSRAKAPRAGESSRAPRARISFTIHDQPKRKRSKPKSLPNRPSLPRSSADR